MIRDSLSRLLRGAGGGAGAAGLGSVVHISSAEDAPDNDSELVSCLNVVTLLHLACYEQCRVNVSRDCCGAAGSSNGL